jgi:peptidoglycan/xylan/chitin deacetylase (PgdA/CDA1 family)
MTRFRIASIIVAVAAVGAFLVGCGDLGSPKTEWNAAPEPSTSSSSPSAPAGGSGGGSGEGTSALAAARTDASGVAGVQATTESNSVALTFDDGPDPNWTPKMLALLKKNNVKATFCLVGVQVQQYPQLVRDIVADGHTLCNHTWKHDTKLGTKGEDAIRADIKKTQDAILAAAPGAQVKYFRHPGGMWTPRAVKVAQSMGMTALGWEVDPQDWNMAKNPAGAPMRDHIVQAVRSKVQFGSIVLSHDAGGDRSGTLAAYEILIPELLQKYQLTAL